MFDGLRAVAKVVERQAHVPKRVGLTPPVADLTGDGQILLVELDGAARLSQISVGEAQVAEMNALGLPVLQAESAASRQGICSLECWRKLRQSAPASG